MRRVMSALILTAAVAAVAAPTQARAEGYVSPWAGVNFGNGDRVDNGRASFGVNAGGMGAGIIGGEVGFGYSPSFFGTTNDFGNNTVIDLMGNVIVGVPIGGTHGAGVRPYVTAGLGLIRTQIDGGTVAQVKSSNNDWGYFNDHVGLRGDLRYFRNIQGDVINNIDFGSFHYWRGSIGVVFR
jgi:hypothetical protein